ncbi:MAG: Uma2 family endonuclease [Spirochaetaceae bacterium]|jgi:Uma2 family endonuclease|nr:Uma2 family endonuclease [Spirochaetaceae bacterium]
MPLLKEQEYYTYADYLSWDGEERYEIIDGEASMMAPPSRLHQEISMALSTRIYTFLEGKPCKVYAAPFAVRLNPLPDKRDDTVVEPDLAVVCDPAKLDDYGCNGAPDLIVEILSPSNTRYDRIVKFQKYREAGVREYWILDPVEKSLMVYVLKNNEYVASAYEETALVPVTALPGLEIDLKTVFVENGGED